MTEPKRYKLLAYVTHEGSVQPRSDIGTSSVKTLYYGYAVNGWGRYAIVHDPATGEYISIDLYDLKYTGYDFDSEYYIDHCWRTPTYEAAVAVTVMLGKFGLVTRCHKKHTTNFFNPEKG